MHQMTFANAPDFIGVGFPRSGTTLLHVALSQHPQLSLPTTGHDFYQKELHYFDRDILKSSVKRYLNNWTNNATVKGEITPAYCTLSAYQILQIKRLFPHLKVLMVIRNPWHRAESHLKLYAHRQNPAVLSDPEALRKFLESDHFLRRSLYTESYKQYSTVFSGQFLALPFSLLTNSSDCLDRVFNFLGVNPLPRTEHLDKVWHSDNWGQLSRDNYNIFSDHVHDLFINDLRALQRTLNDDPNIYSSFLIEEIDSWLSGRVLRQSDRADERRHITGPLLRSKLRTKLLDGATAARVTMHRLQNFKSP